MARRLASLLSLAVALGVGSSALAQQAPEPHAGMLRHPDVSATHIVFVYADDLWLAPREGGLAQPLASPPGEEQWPRFSADGAHIVFSGGYAGGRDLYRVPVRGGAVERLTHHPAAEWGCDFTPDGRIIFSTNALAGLRRQQQLFTISPQGGLPARLPVAYGSLGAISPDGRTLAYTPISRVRSTWKRYRGGQAEDIWLLDLETHTARRATDWEGSDTFPMWQGQRLYYLSDAGPAHRLNLWRFDPATGERAQVTTFRDDDVKFPAIGPGPAGKGEIVFQCGSGLYLCDLASGESRRVRVQMPGARETLRPRTVDAAKHIQSRALSPSGKRVLVEARGDLWSLPAREGSPRNLTRSSGAAERRPAWSPDGRWIAYASDATGEYALMVRAADGSGAARTLIAGSPAFFGVPSWSPNSEYLAVRDQRAVLRLVRVSDGAERVVAQDPWGESIPVSWSPDSRWLAYACGDEAGTQRSVWLYSLEAAKATRVTSPALQADWPAFDPEGRFLTWVTGIAFADPIYEDQGSTFVYAGVGRLVYATLREELETPFAPQSDEEPQPEEPPAEGSPDGDEAQDDAAEEGEPAEAPLVIEIAGLEARAALLPVPAGRFEQLAVTAKGQLVYLRRELRGRGSGAKSAHLYDPAADEPKEESVAAGVDQLLLSADGKTLLLVGKQAMAVVDAAPQQSFEKPVPTAPMGQRVDPRAEWAELLRDAWRRHRDYFYVDNMHGLDWEAVYTHYAAMLPDAVSRRDLSFIIGEMIGELNVGHAYYWGGDVEDAPQPNCGLLGCDFELVPAEGELPAAYRIAAIHAGAPWDLDARNPLREPGRRVEVGSFLLAVNGAPLDPARDPWAAFQGLAGQTVTITVSAARAPDAERRDVVVKLLSSEVGLRYRAWVERKRQAVAERSGGRVAYVHVPDTGVNGQNELFRQLYGQLQAEALLIDERWNGGGQIPTRFVELLNRPRTNYWARRHGRDWNWPYDAHAGPKAMLINGRAGSGGDMFPFLFRQAGLGKLIGTRTWGGLVGITRVPPLIDGGYTAVPTFGFYERDGTWGIEGHGVDPDLEVIDDPALRAQGRDPQLEAGVDHLLAELQARPTSPPARPTPPDRSGMGLPPQDR